MTAGSPPAGVPAEWLAEHDRELVTRLVEKYRVGTEQLVKEARREGGLEILDNLAADLGVFGITGAARLRGLAAEIRLADAPVKPTVHTGLHDCCAACSNAATSEWYRTHPRDEARSSDE
jgi:hypothetical protein